MRRHCEFVEQDPRAGYKDTCTKAALLAGALASALIAVVAPCLAEGLVWPPITEPPTSQYVPGKWVWAELFTEDVSAAVRFYGEAFGWSFKEFLPNAVPATRWRSPTPSPWAVCFSATMRTRKQPGEPVAGHDLGAGRKGGCALRGRDHGERWSSAPRLARRPRRSGAARGPRGRAVRRDPLIVGRSTRLLGRRQAMGVDRAMG